MRYGNWYGFRVESSQVKLAPVRTLYVQAVHGMGLPDLGMISARESFTLRSPIRLPLASMVSASELLTSKAEVFGPVLAGTVATKSAAPLRSRLMFQVKPSLTKWKSPLPS